MPNYCGNIYDGNMLEDSQGVRRGYDKPPCKPTSAFAVEFAPNANATQVCQSLGLECVQATAPMPTGAGSKCPYTVGCSKDDAPTDLVVDLQRYGINHVTFKYYDKQTSVYYKGLPTSTKGVTSPVVFSNYAFNSTDRPQLTGFGISDVDMSQQLARANFTTTWTNVTLTNLNLSAVPTQLQQMTRLQSLDLSKNNINAFPDYSSWQSLTALNLSQNLFTGIPPSVYKLKNLKVLDISGSGLSDVYITQAQAAFLKSLTFFNASVRPMRCRPVYSLQTFQNGFLACVEETLPTQSHAKEADTTKVQGDGYNTVSTQSDAPSNGLQPGWWLSVPIFAVVMVMIVVGVILRRRSHKEHKQSTKGAHAPDSGKLGAKGELTDEV